MNEDYFFPAAKNEIGATWKIAPVESIAIALRMEHSADTHFDPGVLAPYRLHGSPPDLWRFHSFMTFG